MISTTAMSNVLSKEQVMKFTKNNSVEKMKDILSFFVWLYIFGGVGLYLDKLEAIFIPEIKNYVLGRIVLFYVYLSIMMVLNAYTFPVIYNLPIMQHDLKNWQSTIYNYFMKPLFTSNKKDDFHKRLHQFTKNKEL
tara:strand:- start:1081 stop:1488 length:408 start_codon:yes stop_codon:yes gene_type:complete